MNELFESFDIHCSVGYLRDVAATRRTPIFVADYGKDLASLSEAMSRYEKISLDIIPEEDGEFKFCVTGDKIVIEMKSEVLDRALSKKTAEEMLAEIARSGTPEFTIVFTASGSSHRDFVAAREKTNGAWLLVLLACDATVLLVEKNGVISRRWQTPRDQFQA